MRCVLVEGVGPEHDAEHGGRWVGGELVACLLTHSGPMIEQSMSRTALQAVVVLFGPVVFGAPMDTSCALGLGYTNRHFGPFADPENLEVVVTIRRWIQPARGHAPMTAFGPVRHGSTSRHGILLSVASPPTRRLDLQAGVWHTHPQLVGRGRSSRTVVYHGDRRPDHAQTRSNEGSTIGSMTASHDGEGATSMPSGMFDGSTDWRPMRLLQTSSPSGEFPTAAE